VILGAALLVLIALGLFVAGLLSGVTFWYWACVAVSALAAVLLLVARRQLTRADDEAPARPRTREAAAPAPAEERDEAEPEPAGARPESAGAEAESSTEDDESPQETAGATASGAEPPEREAEAVDGSGDPPAEDVEIGDLLLVVEMHDDVFVVDEHPRYHLADCRWLADREAIPLPVDEARTDGFTPCGICSPDRHLAQVARARKSADTS
jgi:hypothetical protein